MTSPYDRLLEEICGGMGYCGSVVDGEPRHVDMYIPECGPVTADQFVEWVFYAEGLDLFLGSSHADDMRKAFVRHMGSDVVDALMLKFAITQSSSSS